MYDNWVCERSSGYRGFRCTVCATWVYKGSVKECKCSDSEEGVYYVVKECHRGNSSQKQLQQVLSRPIKDLDSAKSWASFEQTNYPKHRVFIMQEIDYVPQ